MLRYDTMYVETGRYLRQMVRDVQIAGGKIEVRRFATPADIAALPERLVFNCTGLGSRDLFGDADLHPVRGQLAILEPQPEVRYAYHGGSATCSRAPTASSSAAPSKSINGTRARSRTQSRASSPSHKRFFSAFRCTA